VPGDKSISHRALMLGALADGTSTIGGLSTGADVIGTASIMSSLGATVTLGERVSVIGPPEGLTPSCDPLDCGNSGTTARLLLGLLAGVPGVHHLDGDESLRRRPMNRVLAPLHLMGVALSTPEVNATFPLTIESSGRSLALSYDVPVVSAQVKSAVLFAGLVADGPVTVRERVTTRTNTEDMFADAGLRVERSAWRVGQSVTLWPGRPTARHWEVPGDPSQAAFFAVLAAVSGSRIALPSLYQGPERTGFLRVLERMGARVDWLPDEVVVQGADLEGTEIFGSEIPSVDEVPALAVACAAARGRSVFRDVGELRFKESDRFAATIALVQALGAVAWADEDDLIIDGLTSARAFEDFAFGSALDHRMVMAAAVAGVAGRGVTIETPLAVASSYPHFFADLESVLS